MKFIEINNATIKIKEIRMVKLDKIAISLRDFERRRITVVWRDGDESYWDYESEHKALSAYNNIQIQLTNPLKDISL